MCYVFDTSSFQILKDFYPSRFPTFWNNFDDAVSDGLIISVREVFGELSKWNVPDWLLEWARANRGIFLTPDQAETQFVSEIFRVPHFRSLVGGKERLQARPVADPFVIDRARIRECSVVTQEQGKPNAARIPNVCGHFGIGSINFEGFLTDMGWSFWRRHPIAQCPYIKGWAVP
jgi:hypothetical protein